MNRNEKIAVIALSGGLDSCVTAAIASKEYRPAFFHINYGQRTQKKELECFGKIADYYNSPYRLVVDLKHLSDIGGSSLTDYSMDVSPADLENKEIPSSYVPYRNGNILSVAASWAEVIGAEAIYIGAVAEDSSGYPDCRPEFFESIERSINLGTKPGTGIKIITPVINMRKSEIIEAGLKLGAPLDLTWSCYKSETKACGICDSCALRLRGFQEINREDPIDYDQRPLYI